MKRDFTQTLYSDLLDALIAAGYQFQTFHEYLCAPTDRVVILRHDVDKKPQNSLAIARIESYKKLKASYFFRVVPESLKPEILQQIGKLGHEIGYHYEDMDLARGDKQKALDLFKKNLDLLRSLTPINTICMHGSPLSKYDNRDLWQEFKYQDYKVVGEPYYDLDYSEVFYITDTGRKWNNSEASIRDKVDSPFQIEVNSTYHLINLAAQNKLPAKMMINTHPQRWNNGFGNWLIELVGQRVKNVVKRVFLKFC